MIHLFVEGNRMLNWQHTLLFHSFHNLAAEKEQPIHSAHSPHRTGCVLVFLFSVLLFNFLFVICYGTQLSFECITRPKRWVPQLLPQHLVCCCFLFLFFFFFFFDVHSLLSLLMYVVCWFIGCCYFDSVLRFLFFFFFAYSLLTLCIC